MYAVKSTHDGSVWVAVNNVGIFQYHPLFQKFNNIRMMPPSTEKYLSRVTDMWQHDKEEIIVTTYSGLFVVNLKTKEKKRYWIKEGDQASVNRLAKITQMSDNIYLIEVWGGYIYEWHHKEKLLKPISYDEKTGRVPTFNLAIHHDSQGRTWLGNSEWGLYLFDYATKELKPVELDVDADQLFISYIFEDSKNQIWIGSLSGLYFYDENKNVFVRYIHDEDDENSLVHDRINHIHEDAKAALMEGRMRMQALSLLHQKMYINARYSDIEIKSYFEELIENLSIAFQDYHKRVEINKNIDSLSINIDKAIPLGLIANELITNSFKHVKEDVLKLDFQLKEDDKNLSMSIKDNGSGLKFEQLKNPKSFGISMVVTLIEQLEGAWEIAEDKTLCLRFSNMANL